MSRRYVSAHRFAPAYRCFAYKSLPSAVCASAIALAAGAATAQTTDSRNTGTLAQPTYARLETMEVLGHRSDSYLSGQSRSGTKLDLSLEETPQSVSVITRGQMEDFQLQSMNDVLATTTGVYVQRVETDRTYYTARGFEISNFQVDGLGLPLINNNTHGDLDTALYERVEVVRGANGLMTGVGNPSATVNMVRKRPTEDFRSSVSATAGSWSNLRLDGDVSGALTEAVRGRLVVAAQDKESYLDRYAVEKRIAYGVIDADLSPSTLLTVGVSYQQNDADGNMWGALPLYYLDGTPTDYDRSTNTAADWSYWDVTDTRAFVELQQRLRGGWNLTLSYNHNQTEEDSELFYMYGTPDPETEAGLTGYASEYDLEDEQDLVDVYLDGSFSLGGRDHQLVVGANWAQLDYQDVSFYDYTNGFPPIPNLREWDGSTVTMNFAEGETGSDVAYEQEAIYATARFNLLDGLYLITGGRWNRWTAEGESYGNVEDTKEDDLIPYVGVTYALNDQLTFYTSYTETFVAQTERDAERNRLAPLQGDNLEAGVKATLMDDKLLTSATVFRVTQQNLPVCVDFCNTQDAAYAPSDAESRGVELEVVGQLSEGWQATAGYTYLDIESVGTGALAETDFARVEEYTPEHVARLSTTYRLPLLPQLKIGAQVNWQDDIYRNHNVTVPEGYVNAGEAIVTRQEAYALVDLMANYAISENVTVSVNVKNATDEKYINSLYWDQGYYGAGRNYLATVNWRL